MAVPIQGSRRSVYNGARQSAEGLRCDCWDIMEILHLIRTYVKLENRITN